MNTVLLCNRLAKGDNVMKLRLFVIAVLVAAVLSGAFNTVDAQNKRTGTAAATELLVPIGARDLALGGSSLATTSGVEAIYWNPAGLGHLGGHAAEGMFSSMSYIGDINVNYGAVGASFGEFGVVGFSVKSFDFGDIALTSEDDPEGNSGRVFNPTYVTVGLTYSRALTDAISIGTTMKVISEQIDRVSASGFALDFGVQYRGLVGVRGLHLGVAIKNIGPQMKFDGSGLYRAAIAPDGRRPEQQMKYEAGSFELPSLIEIGLAYDGKSGENMMYGVTTSFTNNNLYLDEYRVGGELGYKMQDLTFFARGGINLIPQAEEKENIFGPTFGVGFVYAAAGMDVIIDYAYRQVEYFDANQVFSLKLGF